MRPNLGRQSGSPLPAYLLTQVILRATAVLIAVAFGAANHMEAVGLYAMGFGSQTILAALFSLNWNSYAQYKGSSSDPSLQKLAIRMVLMSFCLCALLTGLLSFVCYIARLDVAASHWARVPISQSDLQVLIWGIPFLCLFLGEQAYFRARRRGGQFLAQGVLLALGTICSLYYVLHNRFPVVTATMWIISVTNVASALPVVILLRDAAKLGPSAPVNRPVIRESLRYSLPLIPHIFVTGLNGQIDKFLLVSLTDLKTVGVYSTLFLASQAITIVQQATSDSLFPRWVVRHRRLVGMKLVQRALRTITLISTAPALLLLPVLALLGPRIHLPWKLDVALCFVVLAVAALINGVYIFLNLEASRRIKTSTILICSTASFAVNIVSLFILVPWLGIIGAATAFLISMAARSLILVVQLFGFKRVWRSATPLAESVAALTAGAVFALASTRNEFLVVSVIVLSLGGLLGAKWAYTAYSSLERSL